MDFARKQMEKYGWKDGQGLGKNSDGIATAIKPKLKFDTAGIGHDVGAQFTNNWWEKVFNNAANNLDVQVKENGVKVKLVNDSSVEISTSDYVLSKNKKKDMLEYGNFVKTARLTHDGVQKYDVPGIDKLVQTPSFSNRMTDEELFEACGGRTAHKGARHGLRLSGKLSRIEEQEKLLLKKMKHIKIADNELKLEKKIQKLKDKREKIKVDNDEFAMDDSLDALSTCSSSSFKKKKRKNKGRKSVSFNENVQEYYIPPTAQGPSNNNNQADEGIELDIGDNNNLENNDHKSFELVQTNISDLSKSELKKLKKKRKLESKQNRATNKFLEDLQIEPEEDKSTKKRKFSLNDDNSPTKEPKDVAQTSKQKKSKKNKPAEEVAVETKSKKKHKKDKHIKLEEEPLEPQVEDTTSEKKKNKKKKKREESADRNRKEKSRKLNCESEDMKLISEGLDHSCRISDQDD